MDQRNTLKRMFTRRHRIAARLAELTMIKADTVQALRGSASAFLLDPTYGVAGAEPAAAWTARGTACWSRRSRPSAATSTVSPAPTATRQLTAALGAAARAAMR